MDNERIREICLALPHARETLNWGHHLVYWAGDRDIGGKMFAMTDALGARNQKRLWTLYQQALRHGVVNEELHGILFWQVKSMLLAALSKDVKESGLNPFVYGKAKNYAKNFTLSELKKISSQLVTMYHQAHRGEVDFDIALEKFFLTI